MKNILITLSAIFILVMSNPHLVNAQMMGRYQNDTFNSVDAQTNKTKEEEKEGKNIFDRLQSKQITCQALTDDEFELLGEYFMGQMVGDSHDGMNEMMKNMMGEDGEEQMHINFGKRMSGCYTKDTIPSPGVGFFPMMGMMGGFNQPWLTNSNYMINGWNRFNVWNIFIIATWVLFILFLILGIIYYWKGLTRIKKEGRGQDK